MGFVSLIFVLTMATLLGTIGHKMLLGSWNTTIENGGIRMILFGLFCIGAGWSFLLVAIVIGRKVLLT